MEQPKRPVQFRIAEVLAGITHHHGVGLGGVEAGEIGREAGVDQQQRAQRPRAQQVMGRHRRREQFVFGDGDAAPGEFAQQFCAALARGVGDEAQRQTARAQPGQGAQRARDEAIALVEDTAQIEQHGAQLHRSGLRFGGLAPWSPPRGTGRRTLSNRHRPAVLWDTQRACPIIMPDMTPPCAPH